MSLGLSSLRARRRSSLSVDIQITARSPVILHHRHSPVIGLEEDEDDDGITVVDVPGDGNGGQSNTVGSTQEVDGDDEDDEDDDDAATTPSSSPLVTATIFPTTSLSETSTTALPTASSSRIASAIWLTGVPVQTSSFATSTFATSTTTRQTASVGQQTHESGRHHGDSDSPGGQGREHSRPDGTRTKVAIAFGTLGAIGLIVGLIWAVILIRRRRRRRRHSPDEANPRDDPSHIDQRHRFNLNFEFPSFPRLPFSFTSPLARFHKPDHNATRRPQVSSPSNLVYISGHRNAPSDSSIVDGTTQAADRTNGGKNEIVPKGWLDEKRHDPSYPLPLLDPEPVQQANIRRSMVSWFRRSSKHHPLRLNPLRWKSSRASTTSALTGGSLMSRSGSMATTSRTNTDYPTDSRENVVFEGSGSGNFGMLEELPPIPDLGLQNMYSSEITAASIPAISTEETVAAPTPAFTREDARAYYRSMWAESSAAGNTERMSTMSSWTESTMRTSTPGGAGNRESMEQAGLSPPPGFANSFNLNRITQTPAGPVTTTTTTGIISTTGSPGPQTRAKEELYAVHEQT